MLSVVIITSIFILPQQYNKDFKNRLLYVALSQLSYFGILCIIMYWNSHVTLLTCIDSNDLVSVSHDFLYYQTIFHVSSLVSYLGISFIFYCIISWLWHKRLILFMLLSILIFLPIWAFMSFLIILSIAVLMSV